MKPKAVLTTLAVIAVFAVLFGWSYASRGGTTSSQNAGRTNQVKSSLVAPEVFFDFGTISMRNGNVTKEFTVTNPTTEAVTVKTVFTSCMCTVAFLVQPEGSLKGPFGMPGHGGAVAPANETIPAGGSRIVRVVYDPNAHGPAGVGRIDRFVTLSDDSGGTLDYEIKANVTP